MGYPSESTTEAPAPKKNPGGRRRTGYDMPKTVNYKSDEYEWLVAWGQAQNPSMNFSDVVHLMTVEFKKTHASVVQP